MLIAVRSASVGWVDLLYDQWPGTSTPAPPYTPGLRNMPAWSSGPAPMFRADAVPLGSAVYVDGLQAGPRSSGRIRSMAAGHRMPAPMAAVRPAGGLFLSMRPATSLANL